jgi:hypothetical protein
MATPTVKTTDQAVQTILSLLQDLLSASPQTNFTVRLWNGTVWKPTFSPTSNEAQPDRPQKSFTLVLATSWCVAPHVPPCAGYLGHLFAK